MNSNSSVINRFAEKNQEVESLLRENKVDEARFHLDAFEKELKAEESYKADYWTQSRLRELSMLVSLREGKLEEALKSPDRILKLVAQLESGNWNDVLLHYPDIDSPNFDEDKLYGFTTGELLARIKVYLEQKNDISVLSKFWRRVILKRRERINNSLDKSKRTIELKRTLNCIELYNDSLEKLNCSEKLEEIKFLKAMLEGGSSFKKLLDGRKMSEELFWSLIDESKKNTKSMEEQLDAISMRLEKLKPSEIVKFQKIFNKKLKESYRWDIWGAAYLLAGGCSDDAFIDFRAWLIAQGQQVYESTLLDPDKTLSKITFDESEDFQSEEFLMVAEEAYRLHSLDELSDKIEFIDAVKPKGTKWEEKDLPKLFPELARKVNTLI